jgi:hypothetical protein
LHVLFIEPQVLVSDFTRLLYNGGETGISRRQSEEMSTDSKACTSGKVLINLTGATSGTETAYLFKAPEVTLDLLWGSCYLILFYVYVFQIVV